MLKKLGKRRAKRRVLEPGSPFSNLVTTAFVGKKKKSMKLDRERNKMGKIVSRLYWGKT